MVKQMCNGKYKYGFFVVSVIVFAMMMSLQVGAKSSAPKFPKKITLYYDEEYAKNSDNIPEQYYGGNGDGVYDESGIVGFYVDYHCEEDDNTFKISKKVKSSKPEIAKAEIDYVYYDGLVVSIIPSGKKIKSGKTIISFSLTINGKKYNISTEVTIRKSQNPFKSLKVNGKDYTKEFKRYGFVDLKVGKKATIKYELKSNEYKVEYSTKKNSSDDFGKKKKMKTVQTVKAPAVIEVRKNFSKYYIGRDRWLLYLMRK